CDGSQKRAILDFEDILSIFSALVVVLPLGPRENFFRTFQNAFTFEDAAKSLAYITISQSTSGPKPGDPKQRVNITFEMERHMAKTMCQVFMDARLIENAADQSSLVFNDTGFYRLTPKGLHVVERFISDNGINNADRLLPVFRSQPICINLVPFERTQNEDEIHITDPMLTALFRRFAGDRPNYCALDHHPKQNSDSDKFQTHNERSRGIVLSDVPERAGSGTISIPILSNISGAKEHHQQVHKHCFSASSAMDWLRDFTCVVTRDEAGLLAAHFVRLQLITLNRGEFLDTSKAIYRITDEGRIAAQWDLLSGKSMNIYAAQDSTVSLTHNHEE
ncbi:uncharacterized protein LACBIDRAFT_321813, partial [Laccaria bicolor S238N-H82]